MTWPNGSAHVFNAVNRNGTVFWVDAQQHLVSRTPINLQAVQVWHLVLGPDRRPYTRPTQP